MAYLLVKGEPDKPSEPLDDVLRWRYSGNRLHPTQKAVRSLIPFIRVFSKPGDIVLDPFAGAASTAVAALASGRRFIAIELREDYYRIARARVERWKDVFDAG
jgi:DNA modification methylase